MNLINSYSNNKVLKLMRIFDNNDSNYSKIRRKQITIKHKKFNYKISLKC